MNSMAVLPPFTEPAHQPAPAVARAPTRGASSPLRLRRRHRTARFVPEADRLLLPALHVRPVRPPARSLGRGSPGEWRARVPTLLSGRVTRKLTIRKRIALRYERIEEGSLTSICGTLLVSLAQQMPSPKCWRDDMDERNDSSYEPCPHSYSVDKTWESGDC